MPQSALQGIARICALGLALPELLDAACRELLVLSGADVAYLVFLGRGGNDAEVLRSSAAGEWPDRAVEYRKAAGNEELLARLRAHGTVAAAEVSDLSPDDPVRAAFGDDPPRSLMLVPLRFGTSLLGLLGLHACRAPRRWEPGDCRIAEAVGLVLAAALERRRMEERLRASEARYRFLADHSLDFISLHDASGTYRYASPASRTMLGYRPEEMIGCPGDAFLHPDDRRAMGEAHRRLAEGEFASVTIPHRLRVKDGDFREVETVATAVPDDSGKVRQILRVARDVTERKQIENRLFESRKLETVGHLAAGVAHEYNNLLVGINGTVEMLSLLLQGNDEAVNHLAVIERLGDRAVELTQKLMAYARQGKYAPRVLSLSRIVAEEAPVLRAAVPGCVELVLETAKEALPVLADPLQLRQVLMNLCVNAAEAMPGGGTLTVRTREGEFPGGGPQDVTRPVGRGIERRLLSGEGRRGTWAVLEVSDTGGGMDAGTMARIFEPFYSTKFIGRGMGLPAVRGIVETHHGALRVYSEPGCGTSITVSLPGSEGTVAAEEPGGEIPRGKGTILVADDEEDVRSVVRAMLESLGYAVLEARNGREAVDLFRERRAEIAVVLLDMMMPEMTGAEAFAEMNRIAPGVRGILASAYDAGSGERDAAAPGFDAFLQKPFRRRDLGRLVDRMLRDGASTRNADAE